MRHLFTNPMLNKEFKLRFRSFKSFVSLFFYLAILGLIALLFIYLQTSFESEGFFNPDNSRGMFTLIAFVQLALIFFMTPGLTAGVISSEREKQTLNILLTTQQSSTSIILSKLFSSLSFLLLIVISSLPLYSIVFLFGGISPKLLFYTFMIYLFTMITFGSIGVMFSTLIRKTIVAMICTYGVVFFLAAGTALLTVFSIGLIGSVGGEGTTNPIPYFIAMFNPFIIMTTNFTPEVHTEISRYSGIELPIGVGFVLAFSLLTVGAIITSIKNLRPNMKKYLK